MGECCCGILSLFSPDIRLELFEALWGVGGGYAEVGDLKVSAGLLPEKLLLVDGFEVVVSLDVIESSEFILLRALGGGLARIGVKALRKSV